MFHTIAFWENIDQAAALTELAAAAGEQMVQTSGDDIRIPAAVANIVAVVPNIALLGNELRLVSPSLRSFVNPQFAPLNSLTDGNVEPQTPAIVHDLRRNPIPLVGGEMLNAQADANPAAAADQSAIIWLADGAIAPLEGADIRPVRCTAAITAVAGAWTNGLLTFAQDLPAGRFALVGARAQGATLVAARFVLREQWSRPGVVGSDIESDDDGGIFRYGRFGVFGEFDEDNPPTIDILCNDADTAQELILDVVRLS